MCRQQLKTYTHVHFCKNGYPYLGIFFPKKLPISCDLATKAHQIFTIFKALHNFENQTHGYGFFHEKMRPMFRNFLQKTDPKLWHIPCLSCESPPPIKYSRVGECFVPFRDKKQNTKAKPWHLNQLGNSQQAKETSIKGEGETMVPTKIKISSYVLYYHTSNNYIHLCHKTGVIQICES